MGAKPKVSVCIPVYNGLPWIEQTIQSVLAQSLQDFEIVIRDDCSRDGTVEFLHRLATGDERIRVFQNSNNIDVGGQYNLLFDDAVGEFILKLDADDLLAPKLLERAVSAAETNAADVVMAGWEWLDVASGTCRRPPIHRSLREGLVADPFRLVLEKNPFSLCFGIFRRTLLDRIRRDGQFVLFTETCDCECQIRLANAGARFYFIDEVLGQYRLHGTNRSFHPNIWAESALCDVYPYWYDAIAQKLGYHHLRAYALRTLRDHFKAVVRGRTSLSGKIVLGATRLLAGRVLPPSRCLRPDVLQMERTQAVSTHGRV
jgi:glycosyltransferase involved in cell wall biosynthesis